MDNKLAQMRPCRTAADVDYRLISDVGVCQKYRHLSRMLLSHRARHTLNAIRLMSAVVTIVIVVAIWTAPETLNLLWTVAAFITFGFPGAIATLVVKADSERRAKVRKLP